MSIQIIAEVAQGYEGNPKLAELLALGAIRADADAVKFQLVYAEELCTAEYLHHDLFKSLEMDDSTWNYVSNLIHSGGKELYFDVYGDRSLDLAMRLGASGVKISTTDFNNESLISNAVASFNRVLISIGGISTDEMDELILKLEGKDNVTLMYGFQAEPTPIEQNNLLRITELKKRYPNTSIGFMDHAPGETGESFYVSLVAVGLGIDCIEKHITLDPILQIEDYISGLQPVRFAEFVRIIKTMEKALGSSDLQLTPQEREYRRKAMKLVVANSHLSQGEVITSEMLCLKRAPYLESSTAIHRMDKVIGRTLATNADPDQPITEEMLS